MDYQDFLNKTFEGNSLDLINLLPDKSIDCSVTSPPYWGLRDYGHPEQLGLEESPEMYISNMVQVFRGVKRVLKDDGTLWLNIGDSYAGSWKGAATHQLTNKYYKQNTNSGTHEKTVHGFSNDVIKPKDLVGIPWMLAFALRADGWFLRQDIIWHKPNPMPESVTDRCTKAHEYIFLLSKSPKYYYDYQAIMTESLLNENRPSGVERNRIYNYDSKENNNPDAYLKKNWNGSSFDIGKTGEMKRTNGFLKKSGNLQRKDGKERSCPDGNSSNVCSSFPWEGLKANKRSVWTVTTKPFSGAHFAVYPEELVVDCIKAGCPENGIVLDPFFGSGTTGVVARKLNRNFVGFELNPDFIKISKQRLFNELGMFA